MDLTERRSVPLADVLSVTTGVLLSRTRMDGLCALVEWLEREPKIPARMYEDDMHRLLAASHASAEKLVTQHPFLADLKPPSGLDLPDLYSWLLDAEAAHGEMLTVSRAPLPATVAAVDQLTAAIQDNFARLRASLGAFGTAIEAAREGSEALAAQLADETDRPGPARGD
jgi:hypothetical protein